MSFVYPLAKGAGKSDICSDVSIKIDHYIKEVLRIKGSRYMDDSYLIQDKGSSKCLEDQGEICWNSPQQDAVKGFLIFSDRREGYSKACRESIVRQRRKIKKFKKFSDGEMSFATSTTRMSWRLYGHKDAYRTILSMDKLFRSSHQRNNGQGSTRNRKK